MSASASKTVTWDAETARMTMFTLVPMLNQEAVLGLWRRLTDGGSPDEVVSKPSAGLFQASGSVDGEHLLVVANPGRVDVLSVAVPLSGESPIAAAVIGPAPEVLARFASRIDKVLADAPSVHRLAFGTVLLDHDSVETKEQGYAALGRILKTVDVDTSASDLLYQINRPRAARDGFDVKSFNRLSKWSVNSVTFMPIVPAGMQAPVQLRSFRPRLEVDISTPADHGKEIPAKDLARYYRELIDLGLEIATKGDIK